MPRRKIVVALETALLGRVDQAVPEENFAIEPMRSKARSPRYWGQVETGGERAWRAKARSWTLTRRRPLVVEQAFLH